MRGDSEEDPSNPASKGALKPSSLSYAGVAPVAEGSLKPVGGGVSPEADGKKPALSRSSSDKPGLEVSTEGLPDWSPPDACFQQ